MERKILVTKQKKVFCFVLNSLKMSHFVCFCGNELSRV